MTSLQHIVLPDSVVYILRQLNQHGHEAYIVGGCVRDSLMSRCPKDWDITTSAQPAQILPLFDRCIETGIKHGTVTVLLEGEPYEVTTFRVDGEYLDSRHPSSVQFTQSLTEDLARRDFTVNAMAYHPAIGLSDPFGGLQDMEKKMLRAVGDPGHRFQEDALRMLRAIRFAAQLSFTLETSTYEAVQVFAHRIKEISQERIREELTRTLLYDPMKFTLLYETGLLAHILPEFSLCFETQQNHPFHMYNVALHSLHAAAHISAIPHLRWALLLHDIGKPWTKSTDEQGIDHFYHHSEKSADLANVILHRLRMDNKTIERTLQLIRFHDLQIVATDRSIRRAAGKVGADVLEELLQVQAADKAAQAPASAHDSLQQIEMIRHRYQHILQACQPLSLHDLAVSGKDLQAIGYPQGPAIGKALRHLMELVLDDPSLNNREQLLAISQDLLRSLTPFY